MKVKGRGLDKRLVRPELVITVGGESLEGAKMGVRPRRPGLA